MNIWNSIFDYVQKKSVIYCLWYMKYHEIYHEILFYIWSFPHVTFDALIVKKDLSTLAFQSTRYWNHSAWCWQWNFWSSNPLDFLSTYRLSSNEEHPRYLMSKIVFIFAVLCTEKIFHFYESAKRRAYRSRNIFIVCMKHLFWTLKKIPEEK